MMSLNESVNPDKCNLIKVMTSTCHFVYFVLAPFRIGLSYREPHREFILQVCF